MIKIEETTPLEQSFRGTVYTQKLYNLTVNGTTFTNLNKLELEELYNQIEGILND